MVRAVLIVVLALIALYALFIAAVGSVTWGTVAGALVLFAAAVTGIVALRRGSAAVD